MYKILNTTILIFYYDSTRVCIAYYELPKIPKEGQISKDHVATTDSILFTVLSRNR